MKRKMLPLILAATLGIAFQAAQAEIKPLNRVVMEVNSSVITYSDIERTVRELKSRRAICSGCQAAPVGARPDC